ncbi:MAG TPA: hypothetical protein PKA95_11785, partial [Thermomicrobiales bacterium]|nr:hypothetical protein [Thermomicrobiales bacterium]
CPTCRRPLSEHDRDHIREGWLCDGRSRREMRRANQEALRRLKEQGEQLKAEQQTLQRTAKDNAGRIALIGQITDQLVERETAMQAKVRSEAEVKRLEALLAAGDFASEARARLDAA